MSFPAKYAGTCKKCSRPIEKGQYITWNRTIKGSAYHVDCANPDAIPTKTEDMTSAAIQTAIDAAMEKLAVRLGSVPVPSAPSVPEIVAEASAPEPKPSFELSPASERKFLTAKLKDGASWHQILCAICEGHKDSLIRVLLIGPPGTGKSKTSLVLTETPYRVTMTEGMGVEDLVGMYQLIKGETIWVDGPVVRAMKEGKRILVDEIDHHPTEIGSLLYALLDDQPEIMLPTGERVTAAAGYGVIATTNSNVTALPEAVLDRFEAVLPAITPHPDALSQFDNDPMRNAVANHFSSLNSAPWNWSGKPTLRRMRAFARLKPTVGELNAANLAFGTAGKEMLGVLTTAARGKL